MDIFCHSALIAGRLSPTLKLPDFIAALANIIGILGSEFKTIGAEPETAVDDLGATWFMVKIVCFY